MTQYIDKDKVVAEIERLAEVKPIDEFQPQVQNKIDWLSGKLFAINSLRVFLDTLEVKDANEALRTEYEKGRADVIAKACQFLHDYQEYPDHDISPTQLMEAFKDYLSK